MKVCVYGAGAVGSDIAVRLLTAGVAETSVIARGAHLQAIRRESLRLIFNGSEAAASPLTATDVPTSLPAQDLVIVALKAHALPAAATHIDAMLAPGGTALFVVNGIPWWWHHGLPETPGPLSLLDPQGGLWQRLRERTLGGICLWSSEVVRPGVVHTTRAGGLIVGEPDGSRSARLQAVTHLLRQAGMEVRISSDLRAEIWEKLLINASLNPVSALARLATIDIMRNADLRDSMRAVIGEVRSVASACGWEVNADLPALLDPARRPPEHRTSMLQDVLAGRPLETEALLGQVVAFAHAKGAPVPRCDTLLALLRGLDRPTGASSTHRVP